MGSGSSSNQPDLDDYGRQDGTVDPVDSGRWIGVEGSAPAAASIDAMSSLCASATPLDDVELARWNAAADAASQFAGAVISGDEEGVHAAGEG